MAFNGTLNHNEVIGALWNAIISIQTFADNIKGTYSKLVDKARVDGSMFGDTKLYNSTDVLNPFDWGNDAEAQNLLAIHRPPEPETQAIVMDVFKYIPVTVDNYMTKRAFADEGSFIQFNSVVLGWLRDTKRVYDSTTYNTYIGTTESKAERA